jgi:hypothetical protein
MSKKLTLEEWCDETYSGKKPKLQTLWRWARNGNFYPPAEKHGKQYWLTPGTIYINPNDLTLGKKIKEAQSLQPARQAFMEKVINDTAKGGV